jgi:hypothetical protein
MGASRAGWLPMGPPRRTSSGSTTAQSKSACPCTREPPWRHARSPRHPTRANPVAVVGRRPRATKGLDHHDDAAPGSTARTEGIPMNAETTPAAPGTPRAYGHYLDGRWTPAPEHGEGIERVAPGSGGRVAARFASGTRGPGPRGDRSARPVPPLDHRRARGVRPPRAVLPR